MTSFTKAIKLPYAVTRGAYQALVPYDRRLILWTFRRRQAQEIRERIEFIDRDLIRRCRAELSEIIARHPEAKGIVIFPPSVEWDTPLFQRPHQMARAFASLGYLVLYWERQDKKYTGSRFRNIEGLLYVADVPAHVFSVASNAIVISYTYNYNWVRYLNNSPTIVYELIDHLDIFSNFPRHMLRSNHRKLLRRAAVVAGTSDDLEAELKPERSNVLLCPNGVDIDHFAGHPGTKTDIPEDIRPIAAEGKPIIGYYGALAEWFDFELVKYAASTLDQYNFVLIGPDYDSHQIANSGIDSIPNIYWLGSKPYSELPAYLRTFDVATIPFIVTEALQAVSPIKLFEYMAGGKPVVTTDLAECRKYPVVLIAHNPEEWVDNLRRGVELGHNEAFLGSLRQTAEENTWLARARTLANALQATPRGSIPTSSEPVSV